MQNPSDLTPMMLESLILQNLLKTGHLSRSERAKLSYLSTLYENALTLALTQKSTALQMSLTMPAPPPASPPGGQIEDSAS